MNKSVSVAPMMDCTDKHDRYFLRLISKNVTLYTEMIVANAIIKGDRNSLLSFNLFEKTNFPTNWRLSSKRIGRSCKKLQKIMVMMK